jgi:hypothetical protein
MLLLSLSRWRLRQFSELRLVDSCISNTGNIRASCMIACMSEDMKVTHVVAKVANARCLSGDNAMNWLAKGSWR